MENDKKKIGPEISMENATFLARTFGKLNAGAAEAIAAFCSFSQEKMVVEMRDAADPYSDITNIRYILQSFFSLYRRAIADEIKGVFEKKELMLMIDAMNTLYPTPGIAGQQIEVEVSDSIDLEGLGEKWGVEKNAIIGKIKILSLFAKASLEIWLKGFWKQNGEEGGLSIEDYISKIAKEG